MVSRCPSYVDVTLDDWTTSEELFHYDLAILCPPHFFNATFYLPHRALAGASNRTFLVTLDDTHQRHHVFLTAVRRQAQRDDTRGQLSEIITNNPSQQSGSSRTAERHLKDQKTLMSSGKQCESLLENEVL